MTPSCWVARLCRPERVLGAEVERPVNQIETPVEARAAASYHRAVTTDAIDTFLGVLADRARAFYGERLVSLAIFGSHAAGRATARSDIDLFVVLESAAPRRRLRLEEWDRLEDDLAPALERLESEGWSAELSPVIRTREEAVGFSILYLDMTIDVRLLVDRGAFLAARLERMRAELHRLGAERRTLGGKWYWVLKRDYRPGEVFEIR